ncbi:hypothetical protein VNO77_10537 [Canavalia gladiata]|uniref:Uncharacterized protein n=1 Tax=Canavalia gladiata TaxID=3824 RepID=A0AAN9MB14_CANGL
MLFEFTGPETSKIPAHVHIPAELLCLLDVKRDMLKSLYLLPFLMYRIESFMLSNQLREDINDQTSNFNIPSSQPSGLHLCAHLLEAVTHLSEQELGIGCCYETCVLLLSKLNLDKGWKLFYPLLSPIVTLDKLELPPFCELNVLCYSLGYFIKVKENSEKKGSVEHAELSVQLLNALLVQEGKRPNKKTAKGEAAFHLLKEPEGECFFSSLA